MKKSRITLAVVVLMVVLAAAGWICFLGAAADETIGLAIIEDTEGDRVAVEPTSREVWDKLVELYNSKEEMWIGGVVEVFIFIKADPNYPWGFRFNPENITVEEVTPERLQTTIRDISENVDYWIGLGQAYVFAKVMAIHERGDTGDITGPDGYWDRKCDMRDIGLVAYYFGLTVPPANPNCDLTGPTTGVPDGKIDMRDIGLVAKHFGEHYP